MQFERSCGILLHPTALPGDYGIGSLGKEAYEFVDFLVSTHQKYWQIYPLGPTGYGDSPYQCFSAFAGNPLLISLEKLQEDGYLSESDLKTKEKFSKKEVEFEKVINFKYAVLRKAFENFTKKPSKHDKEGLAAFCEKQKYWLSDYALFMAVKEEFKGVAWVEWDDDIRLREPKAMENYKKKCENEIKFREFVQYLFFKEWHELKSYANKNGVQIIGDIPIFVAFDSSDAWANPDIFYFDKDRKPVKVAGVPPDYFSATGQLWGNPLYNWNALKKTDYAWWVDRIRATFETVDLVRIDHFRGFAAYWAVPFGETTAIKGVWETGPGKDLFIEIEKKLGKLPVIAEDLGLITPDVIELRDYFNFPGMKILQFAFDSGEDNDYLPHNFDKNCAVYTGTHDNDTTVGWFEKAKKADKEYALEYAHSDGKDVAWDFIRLAWSSTAVIAVAPLQDLLSLGSEARINTPGVLGGNWMWRFSFKDLTKDIKDRLKKLTKLYKR